MIRSYKVDALVLKRNKKGELDNYYTLLTRSRGLIRVLAKGIRRINSRRAPFFDLFNHLDVFLAQGRSIDIVTDFSSIELFKDLKIDLKKVAVAFKLSELTEKFLPEAVPHQEIYEYLLAIFRILDKQKNMNSIEIVDKYSLFLLHNLGFLPQNQILKGNLLDQKLEEIMEKKIRSNSLLSKLV